MIYKTQQSAFSAGNNYIESPIFYPNLGGDGPQPEPEPDPNLVCVYNVTDTSSPTRLRVNYEPNVFKSMTIDGVLLDNLVEDYQFSSTGSHTVKYELYDDTKLGNSAPIFYNITALVEMVIPKTVTTIGNNAFIGVSNLTKITINNDAILTANINNKFGSQVTEYILGDDVTIIPDYTFYECANLTNITLSKNLVSIGNSAFYNTGIISISIPKKVTSIGTNILNYCTSIANITVDSKNTIYDSRNNCNAIIETATNTLIAGCQTTVIPNTVTTIGDSAFSGTGVISIIIPDNVGTIMNNAFALCNSLTTITLGTGVTTIRLFAFYKSSSLSSVTIYATTPPALETYVFSNNATGRKIYVPAASVDAYKTASNWSAYAADIEAIP